MKKVLIRDRRTAEIWYRLPDESAVRIQSDLVHPLWGCMRRGGGRRGPEVSFTREGRVYFGGIMNRAVG